MSHRSGAKRQPRLRRRQWLATLGATAVGAAGCLDIDIDLDDLAETLDHHDAPVLDPERTRWWSYRNMSDDSLLSRNQRAHQQGLMMVEIGFDEVTGLYHGVWHENVLNALTGTDRAWQVLWDLDTDEFNAIWEQFREDGFRLHDQAHYYLDGERRYAGIWIDNVGGFDWRSHRNSDPTQFASRRENYADDYIPIAIEGYTVNGAPRYAGIWVENVDDLGWHLHRDISNAQFGDHNSKYRSEGYRLLNRAVYELDGAVRHAGIWIENRDRDPNLGEQEEDVGGTAWGSYRNMTPDRYGKRFRMMYDRGYRPISFETYTVHGESRVAGIWRQNARRTTWSKRNVVDEAITDFIEEQKLPSISVAIVRDGVFLYRRGFTNTDVSEEGDLDIDARTRYRLASVSKTVAGVLGFRLQEQGLFNVHEETTEYLETMPPFHDHTVADLLANHGCVQGYGDHEQLPGGRESDFYESALDAARARYGPADDLPGDDGSPQSFWEVPLLDDCTTGSTYDYTTHGFTFAGAAMEEATGTLIGQLIDEHITQPFGLTSMGMEVRTDGAEHRAPLYDADNNRLKEWEDGEPPEANLRDYVDSNSWSVLGGGIESNVYDLARYGWMVLNDELLTPSAKEDMLEIRSRGYAHGWRVDNTEVDDVEYRLMFHGGRQLGGNARLRVFEKEESSGSGVVIAALANRRAEADDPPFEPRPDSVTVLVDDLEKLIEF